MKLKQDIVQRIHNLYRREFSRRKSYLMQGDIALRYYRGDQAASFNATRRTITEIVAIPDSIRNVDNKAPTNIFASEIDGIAALMTNKNPKFICNPSSNTYEDIESAEFNEKILTYKIDTYGEKLLNHKAVLGCALTGTVYREEYWDDSLGSGYIERPVTREVEVEMTNAETGEIIVDEQGMAIMQKITEFEHDNDGNIKTEIIDIGDVSGEMYSIYEVFFDEMSVGDPLIKGSWLLISTVRKIEWVKRFYDGMAGIKNLDNIKAIASNDWGNALNFLRIVRGLTTMSNGDMQDEKEELCILYRYFEPATKEYPDGRMVILAGDTILYDGKNTNIEKYGEWHTFTKWDWNIDPVANVSKPLSADLEMPQRRLNRIDQFIQYYIEHSAAPQQEIARSAGLDPKKMPSVPGAKHLVNQINSIRNIDASPLPQDVFFTRKQITEDMTRLSSSMEAYRLQRTGRLTAVEFQASMDAGYAKVAPILLRYENFLAEVGRKRLKVMKHHYIQNRRDILTGMQAYFKGDKNVNSMSELTSNCIGSSFNIIVEAGSTLPDSRASKQEKIITFAPTGMLGDITNPMVKNAILHELQLDSFAQDVEPDVKRAYMENSMYAQGRMPEVSPVDNHQVHYSIHGEDIKSPDWYNIPEEIRKLKIAHLNKHQEAMQQQQQQQQQMQIAMLTAQQQIKSQTDMQIAQAKIQADLIKEKAYFDFERGKDYQKSLMSLATVQQQTDGAIAHEVVRSHLNNGGNSNGNGNNGNGPQGQG